MKATTAKRQTIVILVHGTNDKKHLWTKSRQPIPEKLKRIFGDRVLIQEFEWSGRNSHKARLIAGTMLASQIRDNQYRFRNAAQFVIGHSHGGNIIRYAVNSIPNEALCSAITVSTPFLTFTPRRNYRDIQLAFAVARWVALIVGTLIWVHFSTNNYIFVMLAMGMSGIVGILAIKLIGIAILLWVTNGLFSKLSQSFIALLEESDKALLRFQGDITETSVPFHCFYTSADEVDKLFHGAIWISRLGRVLTGVFQIVKSGLARIGSLIEPRDLGVVFPMIIVTILVGVSMLAFAMFFTWIIIGFVTLDWFRTGLSAYLIGTYGSSLVSISFILFAVMPVSAILGLKVFGLPSLLTNLSLDVVHAMVPQGVKSVTKHVSKESYFTKFTNAHTSMLYSTSLADRIASVLIEMNPRSVDKTAS